MKGLCRFEEMDPDDLVDAVREIRAGCRQDQMIPPPGVGVETMLTWSRAELTSAEGADDASKGRHAVNAMMHARRALSCLTDWYLERDGFAFCVDPPSDGLRKSELLKQRSIIDDLTGRVLARAVDKRDRVEHDYTCVSLAEAEEVVELVRNSIRCVILDSDPRTGPCFFWRMAFSYSGGVHGERVEFGGWSGKDARAILATFDCPPWIGVILPEGEEHALVRRTWLKDTPAVVLERALRTLDGNFGRPCGGMSRNIWRLFARESGLVSISPVQG